MVPDKFKCPECGDGPLGTVEMVHGAAQVAFDDEGNIFYEGVTEMFWDGSVTEKNEAGEIVFQCAKGHEYAVPGVTEV